MVILSDIITIQIQSPNEIHVRTVTNVPALKSCTEKLYEPNVYPTITEIPLQQVDLVKEGFTTLKFSMEELER